MRQKTRRVLGPFSILHLPSSFLVCLLLLQCCTGCKTSAPTPAADFSAPGWRVQQGQAVWKPAASRLELAGDLLLATNVNGNFFIQFTKTPFPLVSAGIQNQQWQIEFGADKFSWHGHGQPPARFSWFQLPRALLGEKTSRNWRFETVAPDSWRLENSRTGEKLEGAFFP